MVIKIYMDKYILVSVYGTENVVEKFKTLEEMEVAYKQKCCEEMYPCKMLDVKIIENYEKTNNS